MHVLLSHVLHFHACNFVRLFRVLQFQSSHNGVVVTVWSISLLADQRATAASHATAISIIMQLATAAWDR